MFGLSALHWINDALMALFFVLVGSRSSASCWTAISPVGSTGFCRHRRRRRHDRAALVYLALNASSPETAHGWAIPAATDIAFSLGVLALLGSRVPVTIKVFLTALAIIDDVGAIVIIALFYGHTCRR